MNEEQHIQNLRGHMRNISRIPTPYKARETLIHPKIVHWAVYQVRIWNVKRNREFTSKYNSASVSFISEKSGRSESRERYKAVNCLELYAQKTEKLYPNLFADRDHCCRTNTIGRHRIAEERRTENSRSVYVLLLGYFRTFG